MGSHQVSNMFPRFSMCSHQVFNVFPRFPMCSPKVFPIALCFNPICFAQSPPLLTYIGGPKGEALHFSIESSTLGNLHRFNFFLAHCKRKILELWGTPKQLIWNRINSPKLVGCSLQGVLAEAKNGEELFWEEKFHAANRKAQACTQGALLFLPFNFGGESRDFFFIFLWFPMCSHYIPF